MGRPQPGPGPATLRYAAAVGRLRWLVIALWTVLAVASYAGLPNLGNIVAHTSQSFVPSSAAVVTGQNLLKQVNPGHSSGSSGLLVLYRAKGLTAGEKDAFAGTLARVAASPSRYGVSSVSDAANTSASAAKNFFSADGTTEIAVVNFPKSVVSEATAQAIATLRRTFASPPAGASVYLTGAAPIQQDDIRISESGAKKTAAVTIALVLVILLLVFRSLLAPLVTLTAIGLSYLMASGLVGLAAQHGLPVSSFTQTFLIVIMFGAGTDYSIILFSRFREELGKDLSDRTGAVARVLAGVARTVAFSAATVLIAFATLGLAKFGLYQTAVGVAIGMAVVLTTCLVMLPAAMQLFGPSTFWPGRIGHPDGHKPSAYWSWSGRLALRHPGWTLLALAAVLVPVALSYTGMFTYNPLDDIPTAQSAVGFSRVSSAFGAGTVLPTQVVLRSPDDLRSAAGLATIARISQAIAADSAVSSVDSATQPVGSALTAFRLTSQNRLAAKGLAQVEAGLGQFSTQVTGLSAQAAQGAKGEAQLAKALGQLASGSGKAAGGAAQVARGVQTLGTQMGTYAKGAGTLASGACQVASGAARMAAGTAKTATAAQAVAQGTAGIAQGATKLSAASAALANAVAAWEKSHPADAQSPGWQAIVAEAQALAKGTGGLAVQGSRLAGGAAQLAQGVGGLAKAAASMSGGAASVAGGASRLAQGETKLAAGASALARGGARLAQGAAQVAAGEAKLAPATATLAKSVGASAHKADASVPGLAKGVKGIAQLQSGVAQVAAALSRSAQADRTGDPGFYVPASALTNKNLIQAMNAYISANGHVAEFTVVLKGNPYAIASISSIGGIGATARQALAQSPDTSGTVYVTGTTAVQSTMNAISGRDFSRTVVIVFAAIFLLLLLMLRSVLTPLYIIGSLGGTYMVTMGVVQFLTLHVLHKPGLSWQVPFFAFLLLVALGVDYSIFLMTRFQEEMSAGHAPLHAMHRAMGRMGNVVLSAAAIMAGTFGSLLVAGVGSLSEIGIAVMVGLALYFGVFLALGVPACAAILGRAHGWPFERDLRAETLEHGAGTGPAALPAPQA